MATVDQYQRALQQAIQKGDDEAVAYFQGKIEQLSQQQSGGQPIIQQMQRKFSDKYGVEVPESLIAGLVGAGKGMTDIVRGVKRFAGMGEEVDEQEVQSFGQLEQDYPVASTVGEVVGQAAPFLIAGPAAAGIRAGTGKALTTAGAKRAGASLAAPASRGARVAAQAGLGAAEGGLIMAGQGARENEIGLGAGLGATVGGALELALPGIGRAFRKIGGKLKRNGSVSPELLQAIRDEGVDVESARPVIERLAREYGDDVNAKDLAGLAMFEQYDIPRTRGDIIGHDPVEGFPQMAAEAQLLESATDPLGAPIRSTRLQQSERIKSILDDTVNSLGLPDSSDAGEAVKAALIGRKKGLKKTQRELYSQLAEEARNVDVMPIMIEPVDAATRRRIGRLSKTQANAVDDLMLEFGIGDRAALEKFAEAGNEITPLNLSNAEEFRQALNAIERSDQTNTINVITGPLKSQLDTGVDDALAALETAGRTSELGDIAKQARDVTKQVKTEFSPQAVTGRLIDVKRDGVTPVVEASNVLDQLFKRGTKSRVEMLDRTLDSLRKAGPEGKRAIGDMQAAALQKFIDDSFNAATRTINGERVFSGAMFQKALDKFGRKELEMLFKNNPQALKKILDMENISKKITVPSAAVPKGSGSVILDAMNSLGIQSIATKIPGGNLAIGALDGLAGKAQKRATAKSAGKAVPRWTPAEQKRISQIQQTMPALAVSLGLSEDEDEPLQ